MNRDIFIQVALRTDPDTLKKMCVVNKFYHCVYSDNKEYIFKKFLEKYQVEYSDPTNFIYVYNKVSIENYVVEEKFKYQGILDLYMKNFYLKDILYSGTNMTTFPIYPNMTHFFGERNKLTSFPVQPNMLYFNGDFNQLTSFPVQPNMTHFNGRDNKLTFFNIQPNMTHFTLGCNQLTSFPAQPKMS